jgi:hypothetical protein
MTTAPSALPRALRHTRRRRVRYAVQSDEGRQGMHAMRTKEPKVAVYPTGWGMGLRLVFSGYMLRAGLRQRARIRGAPCASGRGA